MNIRNVAAVRNKAAHVEIQVLLSFKPSPLATVAKGRRLISDEPRGECRKRTARLHGRSQMTMDELREFVRMSQWIFARTMPQSPHEYTLRAKAPDEKMFERVVLYIRQAGYKANFGPVTYTYLDIDGWKYWTMGAPLGPTGSYDPEIHTILINRAQLTMAIRE